MSRKIRYFIIGGAFLALCIAGCLAFIFHRDAFSAYGRWGYPVVFMVSFVAGSSLPVPAPYIVIVFGMASVMNPLLVGFVGGLGAAIGSMLVYLFGRSGQQFFPWVDPEYAGESAASRWTSRLIDWAQARGSVVVFLMSAVFNPVFAPMAFTMGAIRFKMLKFFLMCWAGCTVKSLFIAGCGYYGLGALLRWLGADIP